MKVSLCIFFNYPYERNIPVLERFYSGLFDNIIFIQPFISSPAQNVRTVYRAAFNFGGYFADSKDFIESLDSDYYVFAGDDCLINRSFFGPSFKDVFLAKGMFSAFCTKLLPFCNGNELNKPHKITSLARFSKGNGLYEQRIEGWQAYLPDPNYLAKKLESYGITQQRVTMPSKEKMVQLSPAQREVIENLKLKEGSLLPYPLVYAISDFFIVSSGEFANFCQIIGVLASMNIFPEVAVPTALAALNGRLVQAHEIGLSYDWSFGRDQAKEFFRPSSYEDLTTFMANRKEHELFVHPIKLSGIMN